MSSRCWLGRIVSADNLLEWLLQGSGYANTGVCRYLTWRSQSGRLAGFDGREEEVRSARLWDHLLLRV